MRITLAHTVYLMAFILSGFGSETKAADRIEGQTSGEWFLVNRFNLPQGNIASVNIPAKEEISGSLAASAVLFVPDFK